MNDIVTKVNEYSGYSSSEREYPNIEILGVNDALAVLMSCLKTGQIPVYMEHNGNLHKLKTGIDPDPMNLRLLLQVYNVSISLSSSNRVVVKNTEELLDLGKWW